MNTNSNDQYILWLTRDDIIEVGGNYPSLLCEPIIDAVCEVSQQKIIQPLKPYLRIPNDDQNRRIIAMPCYLPGDNAGWGLKWIASSPLNPSKRGIERASALIVLNDLETGYPLCIMEGALISAARTAAVALIASRLLAPSSPSIISLIGTGLIGRMILECLLSEYSSVNKVILNDINHAEAEKVASTLATQFPRIKIESKSCFKDLGEESDILITATTAQSSYLPHTYFTLKQGGCLYLNISLRDAAPEVLHTMDKVVVDSWEHINCHSTIIHHASQAGIITEQTLWAELPELLMGSKLGRQNDKEKIIFCPMGLAIYDISAALYFYRKAVDKNLGQKLSLYR
jgi:N-[(2S)-2-amino-2-carboxyethyl]-L-glutamate dehydrogenase